MFSFFDSYHDPKNIRSSFLRQAILTCLLFLFCLTSSLSSAPELAAPSPNESAKLFILDASGSMNEYLGIYQKIHLAKKYVRHYADSLPEETEIGFIAYGNRLPGCQSSRLYQPLEKGNKPQFRNKLFGLTPSGATPLAESIRIAGDYISRRKIPTELILVTDGVESCYGDPEKELKVLKQKGIDFKMNVLGLGLKPDEKKIMESLAKSGNGKYYNVDGDNDFYSAVDDLLKQEPHVKRTKPEPGKKSPKVRIVQIDTLPTDRNENLYGVRFEFENANSNNQCVLLNLKQNTPSSIDPKDWNKNRASHPENVIRTDQACFKDQKGEGIFKIHLPKDLTLNLELELWDMQDIPNPVDKSGERSIRD
ncbi:VWA domain-containing protein [Leptospira langatensis]|uniref:VWA domain-containing protein n=1 Tax=Leptospira langatensis TaxID=2484983 RepID=A0A5F1ZWP7_9LEPT|nr:VWA domain-containing protein [Leptospira langatensis]TGK01533.1 VWA domain-containing protein [Leptospira langatensis]TGL42017.1 VWA domain-containing protein [Leptospira langatensis]